MFFNTTQKPFIIAGPCSAETEEQLMSTAVQLSQTGKINALRAGIWKPRTRPETFAGVGLPGLEWMQQAKQETGLPIAIEVASPYHVEMALKYGIDIIWLGARTTGNPFSVQEIADSLKGVFISVLIKNPVQPDIDLWSGGADRLLNAGITDLGLVHRGFHTYRSTGYRNNPLWHLAIEMKNRYPAHALLCDPSHIVGKRDGLLEVCQKSIDLNYDGLMIESHNRPDQAWSDAAQQITPLRLKEMLDALIWRREESAELHPLIEELRRKIDCIDDELFSLISDRMKIVRSLSAYKKEKGLTIVQTGRWTEILQNAAAKGEKLHLATEFIEKYMEAIHSESIRHQTEVFNSSSQGS